MPTYGDATQITQRSGVTFTDLGLANQAALDTLITELNKRASDELVRYCGRDFDDHVGVTDKLDGNDRSTIRLPGWPVRSIAQVKLDGTVLAATEYRVKDVPGRPGVNAGILERKDADWTKDWQNLEVTYTWGYATPPDVVSLVVEDLVVNALLDAVRNKQVKGASSMSMDGFSAAFSEPGRSMQLTADHRAALQRLAVVVAA